MDFYKIIDSIYIENENEHEELNFNMINDDRITFEDFSGIYFQTSFENALNYLEHKAEISKSKYLYMIKFTTNCDIKKIDNKIYGNNLISSESKCIMLKKELNINNQNLLIDSLNVLLIMEIVV